MTSWRETELPSFHVLLALALALLVAGFTPALAQGAKPGHLDHSFGNDGKVGTEFCGHARSFSGVIDRHGRTVVAGTDTNSVIFCIARYRRNGNLDRSFSHDGEVITQFDGAAGASSLAIDSRGRIVAAGAHGPDYRHQDSFAVARYKPSGDLDHSFGAGGKVTTEFGAGSHDYASAYAVAIDARDRIVAAGFRCIDYVHCDVALTRYRWSGGLDPSFGAGGKVLTSFGPRDAATSVAIDSQGRIVAAGYARNYRGDFVIARYGPNGTPDGSFGSGGQVTTGFGSGAGAMTIDSRDRIVAAGGYRLPNQAYGHFELARYKANGHLDRSFSGDGQVATAFGGSGGANAVAIDSRRRIVAVGGGFDLARYKPNGTRDRSFGTRGKVRTGWVTFANSAAIDSRDRIVVVGFHSHLVLARFIGYSRR